MNGWQKRPTMIMPCPSGAECKVHRPGPELSLKAGRLAPLFGPRITGADAQNVVEQLSDEEAAGIYLFARQVMAATILEPRITLDGRENSLTPDDIPPADFWHVFTWFIKGCPDIPVKTKEGETTVEAVENFPLGQDADVIAGGDSEQVS